MWRSQLMDSIYCDVPGSPCLSKNGSNVQSILVSSTCERTQRIPGPMSCRCLEAGVVRWRPHLAGMGQYCNMAGLSLVVKVHVLPMSLSHVNRTEAFRWALLLSVVLRETPPRWHETMARKLFGDSDRLMLCLLTSDTTLVLLPICHKILCGLDGDPTSLVYDNVFFLLHFGIY